MLYILGGYSIAAVALWVSVNRVEGREFRAVAAQLPQLNQKAQDLGIDLDVRTALNRRPIKDSENAAQDFSRAYQITKRFRDEGFNGWNKRLESGKKSEIESVLKEFHEREIFVSAYERAVQKPHLAFRFQWPEDAYQPFLGNEADIEIPLRLIAARINVEAKIGKVDEALRELDLGYKLCRLTQEYPYIRGLNLQNRHYSVVDNAAIQLIPYVEQTPNSLEKLRKIVNKSRSPQDPEWIIRTECAMLYQLIGQLKHDEESWEAISRYNSLPYRGASALFTSSIPATLDRDTVIRAFQTRILQSLLPALQRFVQRHDPIEFAKIADAELARRSGLSETDSTNLICNFFSDTFTRAFDNMLAIDTRRLLILGLIQVVEQKNREGRAPKSLAGAKVEYTDPFSPGSKLRYLHFGKDIILYSVGPNRVDDGGVGRARDIRVMYSPNKKPLSISGDGSP